MSKNRAALCLAATIAAAAVSISGTRGASAATTSAFTVTANAGGGDILTGTLGNTSLTDATAALMRRVHAALGSRPKVVQSAANARGHSLALLFTANRHGTPYTGVAIVTAHPGSQAAGAALYDASSRFQTTLSPLLKQLQSLTGPIHITSTPPKLAPAQPLAKHGFSDGTGSISIPDGWTVQVAGGGSAQATAAGGAAQVSYNMHFGGLDPSNPRAQMFLRTASPLARQNFHGLILAYTSDPVRAWTEMYEGLARRNGVAANVHVISSSPAGDGAAHLAGTLGSGAKAIRFMAFVFVLPPNPNGLWTISDNHIFIKESQFAQQAETANAVLNSVRINFGAVAQQQDAIRAAFQKQFETEIANDRAADAQRYAGTQRALASDRAAQEGMHKEAVAMENYSLDRAVIVDTRTGGHATVGAGFADALVQGNPNYQKVSASGLLRGVDY